MLKVNRHAMPEQPAEIRRRNFEEVALGYDEATAIEEAKRCLNCPKPRCVEGCPVNIYIPKFVHAVSEGDFASAIKIIKEKSSLPAVCGRVCPQEKQCESRCVLGIKGEPVAIGRLERFVADYAREHGLDKVDPSEVAAKNGKKVAIVGSGPSGLACAGVLAQKGYDVTIFEVLHAAGGVLMYGIPQFRLPKEIVQHEIEGLKFNGVYAANEFLTRVNLMKAYTFPRAATPVFIGKKVAVVGGGNVAMDAARTAMRLGAEHVYIVYRRGEDELPARKEEVGHAKEEGIEFCLLNNPVRIVGNEQGWVTGLECVKMELGEPDASGRRSPVAIKDSNYVLEVDEVIMAIGQGPNPLIHQTTPDLEVNRRGNIVADENGATSMPGVYADIVTGAATVISAMGAGKRAAAAIDEYLMK